LLLFVYNSDNAMHIKFAHFLGIIFSLAAFWIYLKISKKYQLPAAILLYLLLYFVSGGNALLFVGLIILGELFQEKKSYSLILLLIVLAAIVPFLSYKFLYITSIENAFLSLTPFTTITNNIFYSLAWYGVLVIYFIWLIINRYTKSYSNLKPVMGILLNLIVVCGVSAWGIKSYDKHEMEYIMHMAYEVEQGNWDKVLEMGNKVKFRNAVPVAYFMNIAHSEKGDLASEAFKYRQTGTYGLYVSWALHHTTDLYIGELYYRMGLPAIAEQCAFEAMVTSPYEHSSKALRRIVQTNMLRKDVKGFEKYIRLFEKSPVYKGWAKEQRKQFELSLNDPTYKIPDMPEVAEYQNFFFASGAQENNLAALINYDPKNKKAFEYMAMTLLLTKNLVGLHSFMEKYYDEMSYSQLPLALEEALVILAYNGYEEVINQYNVSKSTLDRFAKLNNELNQTSTAKAKQKLRERYKDTYWIYYQFVKPMELKDIPGMMVY
ncbi:MAG: DUF6057 family protein, partial [Bacteroidales bacterium]|nr:DUF6057 family protein [Bacteroidales bacterium]